MSHVESEENNNKKEVFWRKNTAQAQIIKFSFSSPKKVNSSFLISLRYLINKNKSFRSMFLFLNFLNFFWKKNEAQKNAGEAKRKGKKIFDQRKMIFISFTKREWMPESFMYINT